MNDDQIIQLFFARNEDAIAQTACRYGTRLTRLSANILHSNEDAQECVNDTYLRAWDTIPPTRPGHLFAYLAKICRSLALDRLDWGNAAKRKAEVVALTQEMEECIPGAWREPGTAALPLTVLARPERADSHIPPEGIKMYGEFGHPAVDIWG